MATTTKQDLDALILRVGKTDGFEVADLGMRWRVTNRQGGEPLFIPKRPPTRNNLTGIKTGLAKIGWNDYNSAEEAEAARQARLKADQDKATELLRRAEIRIAEEQARHDAAEQRRQLAEILDSPTHPEQPDIPHYPTETMRVDVSFARGLLEEHNVRFQGRRNTDPLRRQNRPLDKARVEHYGKQMLKGRFPLTHQGLAVDSTGFLLDGQHRLEALVWAGQFDPQVSFVTKITYDLPPEVMDYIDTGKYRTPADVLALHNEGGDRLVLASSLRLTHLYDNVPYGPAWRAYRMTNADMLDHLNTYPDMREAVAWGQQLRGQTTGTSASVFLYVAGRCYRDAPLQDFVEGLRTGANLAEGDARLAFRSFRENMSRGGRSMRRRSDSIEQLALLIKTWNAYLMERYVAKRGLRWREDEQYPRPIERD